MLAVGPGNGIRAQGINQDPFYGERSGSGQACPMPLGIGAWSGGCQAQNSALWKRRKPRSPSPRPSPQRRGRTIGRGVTNRGIQTSRATTGRAPSPWGEGWSEVVSKAEARSPKAERRPSSEIRRPKPEAERGSDFGLRVSACSGAAPLRLPWCELEL